ncbi:MAG: cation-translocating P-type ATPase [Deltaproteobacteria bacterium]|nr:cation-translocating P-type ATPase [Deltaproteobacteria bacterium]
MDWCQKNIARVVADLKTNAQTGLSSAEARARLSIHGQNKLLEAKRESRVVKFLKHFTEFIVIVLIGAAIIAGILGEWVDALAIMAIVVMNGMIGFVQDEKAEAVLEALKRLSAPSAKALRDGNLAAIEASGLAPGDIIVLEAGDSVPADCRIIEAHWFKIDESTLTGESHPINKDTVAVESVMPLADRTNMAYLGTHVVYGRARAAVVATGMSTEMGKIAKLLSEAKTEPTPLQKRLDEFGKKLVYAAGFICAVIFVLGILRGGSTLDMFLTAVSLAVAAIPEGLPAVVTITLALGVQRMVWRHALIKKLPSVETLGSASVIASDKTGTLTQNQMTVRRIFLASGEVIGVAGAGYSLEGGFHKGSAGVAPNENPGLLLILKAGALCNASELKDNGNNGMTVLGDPTEGALLVAGRKAGVKREDLLNGLEFVLEIPFDAGRKMMTSVYKDSNGFYHSFTKGAPERIVPLCSSVFKDDSPRTITRKDADAAMKANAEFSSSAQRVLALACRSSSGPFAAEDGGDSPSPLEKDLTFLGLMGMSDPPREEVFVAVEKARAAGITPIMITGDHLLTAVAIAKELDIFRDGKGGDRALTGEELDMMSEAEFMEKLPRIKVYARVNPEHKLKIVRAWKKRGDVIAMTGDGVNDAPALKEADIGVAMGITGSDVTKEASDMVLTDDNFASIVAAVEEGRNIFGNIRKAVHFLLSCNIGEILVLLIASIAGMPLPLLPVQILWTNLVTDGLPAIGLAMEGVEPGVMDRPPRDPSEGIVGRPLLIVMTLQGAFIAFCTLFVFAAQLYWFKGTLIKAQTMAFTVLVFCQKFHVFNCRSALTSVFKLGVFSNKMLNWAVFTIFASQLLLIHIPALQAIFKVVPLSFRDWAIVFAASSMPLALMEIVKLINERPRKGID